MTIFALSTANGIAGLAVVRVSGHLALTALKTISRKSHFDPNVLTRTSFYDSENGNLIDRGLAVYFAKPKSFTGEDVVEFHIHGGRATVDLLLKTLSGINQLRLAEPGEFSKRAFINNKMDLTAIEAMGDLINAQTELQHNQALSQMDGSLNKLYLSWRKSLIELVAYLEADIDFAEEDIPDDVLKNINANQIFSVGYDGYNVANEFYSEIEVENNKIFDSLKLSDINKSGRLKHFLKNSRFFFVFMTKGRYCNCSFK